MVVPGFVFWSLMMPGFPWCLGVVAPKLLRRSSSPESFLLQFQNGRLLLLFKPNDLLVTLPKKRGDLVGRAVTAPNPHKLRRRPTQDRQPVEVLVLAHDQAIVRPRDLPNRGVSAPP